MAEVSPFAAIRYDFDRLGGDLSPVLAPPYDVLDQADKDALLARSNRNVVAIDLPHIPPKSAGPTEVYQQSARLLEVWLSNGTLMREDRPGLYLYHQKFEHAGRSYTRRKFIARVRLQPFSEGTVLPHEQTFGGPKEDRLALMTATGCQLSPIFGLFADPDDATGRAFAAVAESDPDAIGTLEGVEGDVWVVRDDEIITKVVAAMADRRIYIADGHHRYGTALMYRDFIAREAGGTLPADHPANFVMFVLASMDDPGCLILPYHRALGGVDVDSVLEAWRDGADVAADRAGPASAEAEGDLTVYDPAADRAVSLRFTNRAVLRSLEPDQVEPWYDLDYAYLHRYLIDERLATATGRAPDVHYVKSSEAAVSAARQHRGVALLMNATPMAHLRAVSEAGGLMPQKSTYFYPKLATGITINPLK